MTTFLFGHDALLPDDTKDKRRTGSVIDHNTTFHSDPVGFLASDTNTKEVSDFTLIEERTKVLQILSAEDMKCANNHGL